MQKYRDWTSAAPGPTTAPMANRSGPIEPSIEHLANTYGLGEEDKLDWSGETSEVQSVEQEFQAYIMELRSAESDILHYWQVSMLARYLFHLVRLFLSCTRRAFQLSMPWWWITYQSRHHRFRAKESSHQVVKQIQRNEIASMVC